ncbi:sialic acid-binding Ig-like lectin 5 isoform X3 [Sphaeramia orbicularis]|uniref:sialic acid-binding Ig-like lectin 5 isoform X3 n=1 Tax=Sphaeramia orbicularis TaxID=375764 RepID=UPI00117E0182|nr:sialic acid-binding Ig-like lectin 5 isoform X3 [Sphaeramia orbicularis]
MSCVFVLVLTDAGMTGPICLYRFCISLRRGKIKAEAGLCTVIPCSFTTAFSPITGAAWYKCDESKRSCDYSDIIFHSWNQSQIQPGFRGRISMLEPNLSQGNCSIVINDLDQSDSGSYQFKVTGWLNNMHNEFLFLPSTSVSVKALTQKPTVKVPALTEGQQTTLTCTAPSLCSGSDPNITWTWRRSAEDDSYITGNITTTHGHNSSLTFTPSAKHHSTEVTCKVNFRGNKSTQETVTLNVAYMKEPVITGDRRVKRGDALNLTCSFDSFPPSVIIWAKLGPSGTKTNLQIDTGSATLVIHDMTADDSGQYVCTRQYQGKTSTAYVNVTVFLLPEILKSSGCVSWSEVLTCVCVSEGLPLPTITWPLLDKHTEYSGTYTVSKYTINRTITVKVKELSSTDVQCVSTNEYGEAVENLIIRTSEKSFAQENGGFSAILLTVTVVSLIVNILLIVCLIFLWNSRKKLKQNQEDQTYLTLSKRDISPDVVAQQVSASVD